MKYKFPYRKKKVEEIFLFLQDKFSPSFALIFVTFMEEYGDIICDKVIINVKDIQHIEIEKFITQETINISYLMTKIDWENIDDLITPTSDNILIFDSEEEANMFAILATDMIVDYINFNKVMIDLNEFGYL